MSQETLIMSLMPFLGRLHPLFVHLPIGILILAFIMEVWGRINNKNYLKESVRFTIAVGVLASIGAAISGLILSNEGGYGAQTMLLHQWSGIGTTLLSAITFFAYKTKAYLPVFSTCLALVFITGHLGGNLTHGSSYLTEHLPDPIKTLVGAQEEVIPMVPIEDAIMFPHVIQPILKDKCSGCHNPDKLKGELRMDTFEELLKGGENGLVIESGDASSSEMIIRSLLPAYHDDAMPPDGKPRLTDDELEILQYWIDAGLQNDVKVVALDSPLRIVEIIAASFEESNTLSNPVYSKKISPPSGETISQLEEKGFTIIPIEEESNLLQVQYFKRANPLTDEHFVLLNKLASQIVWLDLTGIQAEGNDWSFLQSFENLIRINLSNTTIDDRVINQLSKLEYLEKVNLFNTAISNKSLQMLAAVPLLKHLILTGVEGVSDDTVIALKNSNEELKVEIGG